MNETLTDLPLLERSGLRYGRRILGMIILAAFLLSAKWASPTETGFAPGETFTYEASWGMFSGAARIVITANQEETGEDLVRIVVDTWTTGLVSGFFPLETRSVALLDASNGRILHYRETGFDGRRGVDRETSFDYAARRAVFVDRVRPKRNRTIDFSGEDNPTDLILGLIQTRRWHLQVGEESDLLVYAGRDIYPLSVRAERHERVRTPLGNFRALVLEPRMRGTPRGIFENGDGFRVWIGGNDEPLPIRIQVRLELGLVTMTLINHDPGKS
jgi:hypothetical protein